MTFASDLSMMLAYFNTYFHKIQINLKVSWTSPTACWRSLLHLISSPAEESCISPWRWVGTFQGGGQLRYWEASVGRWGCIQESPKLLTEAGGQQNGRGKSRSLASGWQQKCEGNLLKSVLRLKAAGRWQESHKGHCSHSICAMTEGAVGPGPEEAAGLWGGSKCWGRKQVVTGGGKDEACAEEHLPLTLTPVKGSTQI